MPCVLRAWAGEVDVLLAHLKENDLCGPLTFIDKAQGVLAAQRLLAAELASAEISQRRLVALLKARGYSLSQGLVSHMQYAVERLLHQGVRPVRRAFQSALGYRRLAVTRIDLAQGTAKADRARAAMGEVPEDILAGMRRAAFAPSLAGTDAKPLVASGQEPVATGA